MTFLQADDVRIEIADTAADELEALLPRTLTIPNVQREDAEAVHENGLRQGRARCQGGAPARTANLVGPDSGRAVLGCRPHAGPSVRRET